MTILLILLVVLQVASWTALIFIYIKFRSVRSKDLAERNLFQAQLVAELLKSNRLQRDILSSLRQEKVAL